MASLALIPRPRLKESWRILAALVFLLGASAWPANPTAAATGLDRDVKESILILNGLQAELLQATLAITLVNQPGQIDNFRRSLEAFDRQAARFKRFLRLEHPRHKVLAGYFDRLVKRRQEVEAAVRAFSRAVIHTGRPSETAQQELLLTLNRLDYAQKRTRQHLVQGLANPPSARSQVFSEALLVMEMHSSLVRAVRSGLAFGLQRQAADEVAFWNALADLDLTVTIYRFMAAFGQPEQADKIRAFEKVMLLRDRVLDQGERYLDSIRSGPGEAAALAKSLEEAASSTAGLFQELLEATLR